MAAERDADARGRRGKDRGSVQTGRAPSARTPSPLSRRRGELLSAPLSFANIQAELKTEPLPGLRSNGLLQQEKGFAPPVAKKTPTKQPKKLASSSLTHQASQDTDLLLLPGPLVVLFQNFPLPIAQRQLRPECLGCPRMLLVGVRLTGTPGLERNSPFGRFSLV